MAHIITITSGADEGRSFEIEKGDCLVGRSDKAQFRLSDESVSWEHAVFREVDDRLIVENLSALGTKVRGEKITAQTRLVPGDAVELSPRCRLRVEPPRAGAAKPTSTTRTLVVALAALLLVAAAVLVLMPAPARSQGPPRLSHWNQAYLRIEERLGAWERTKQVPAGVLDMFREAWRRERAGDTEGANLLWRTLHFDLMTLPVPGAVDGQPSFATSAASSSRALRVLMGYDPASAASDFDWTLDSRYVDAMVWFVRQRAQATSPRER